MTKPVYVTSPFLPPLEDVTQLLEGVWESGILTHNGPLVQKLERELCDALSVRHMVAVTNGTIALQMAIRALDLRGEILTTPFSWIATCSSIMWEHCQPKFVDIDPETFNIDPSLIEAQITSDTVAIMPVHTFGNPCDVDAIQEIADRRGLKLIYDAAHAVGSTINGKSVLEYGDISATSFHATKLFQTGEGGGCITTDTDLAGRLKRLRFFGHNDQKDIIETGFNGKMTEIHAAIGLAVMPHLQSILDHRSENATLYRELLNPCESITFQKISHGQSNFSYFPIVLDSKSTLGMITDALNKENIFPRRYFHPSLNKIPLLGDMCCPLSESIASRILCLPHSPNVDEHLVEKISQIVLTNT
jgi:dTDP-4-amino-4,6-dideoxygalactose transaminase